MEEIKNKTFVGERSLFTKSDLTVDNCLFGEGESPLKEGTNIKVLNSTFGWKYPLWYGKNILVENTKFEEMARAGIWYTQNIKVKNCVFYSPKMFRRCKFVELDDVKFLKGEETFWACENVRLFNITSAGPYFGMNSKKLFIKNFKLDGNYPFDGCTDLEIHDSVLNSKDAFWNCKHVKVVNCTIKGEYLGWNSEDVTFIDCRIESLQGMCYMKNVKLINCTLVNTTLAFEYSSVDAEVNSVIDSVKNPFSGKIVCEGIKNLIMEKEHVDPSHTIIIQKESKKDDL